MVFSAVVTFGVLGGQREGGCGWCLFLNFGLSGGFLAGMGGAFLISVVRFGG